jgi:hypothetical protein
MIIISWIIGGLLPVVALGMTALVANQLKHIEETQEPVFEVKDPGPDTSSFISKEVNPEDEYEADVEAETLMDSVPKKAEEPLAEEIKVPYTPKYKRFVNPLNKKSRIARVRDIKEISQPSKGDEVIALIEKEEKAKVKESINNETIDNLVQHEIQQESFKDPANESQVIDVKAVPKRPPITDFWGGIVEQGT